MGSGGTRRPPGAAPRPPAAGGLGPQHQQREPANLVASAEAEVRHLTPAVLLLLRGLLLLQPAEAFDREAGWLCPRLADLVVVRSLEVRAVVRELLTRIAPLIGVPGEA
ncbi:unnamed protein product [Ectocarpus sp. 12 AP-2014]